METKKLKIALYRHVQFGYESVWAAREDGAARDLPDHVRISEWVEVEFQPLPDEALRAANKVEMDKVRARLTAQLAALDAGVPS